ARAQARSRDPVLRLHLARDDAVTQRTAADPLALLQRVFRALRAPRSHWRLPDWRRYFPLAMRRNHLYSHSWTAGGVSVQRAGRGWFVAHRDSLRRSRPVP